MIGGEKLSTNFLPGPDSSGIFAARAFRTIAHIIMSGDRNADASQMFSAPVAVSRVAAATETISASTPIATIPHPDTAVNEPAASIVLRMKARLSIALPWSDESSGGGVGLSWRTDVMGVSYRVATRPVKYFAPQSR